MVVTISERKNDSKYLLVCLPPGGGNAFCYFKIAKFLNNSWCVLAIENSNLDLKNDFIQRSLVEEAKIYSDEILKMPIDLPIYLLGWSYGGVLAVEVAKQLREKGVNAKKIMAIDSHFKGNIIDGFQNSSNFQKIYKVLSNDFYALAPDFLEDKGDSNSVNNFLIISDYLKLLKKLPINLEMDLLQRIYFIHENSCSNVYRHHGFSDEFISITLIKATLNPESNINPNLGWDEFKNIEIIDYEANHYDIINESNLSYILNNYLLVEERK